MSIGRGMTDDGGKPLIQNISTWLSQFLDFWKSIKLSIVLFSILIVLSVIGTLIPQNTDPSIYIEKYGPGMAYLFQILGFTNMYYSGPFTLLLIALGINTLVCGYHRYVVLKRFLVKPNVVTEDKFYSNQGRTQKTNTSLKVDKLVEWTKNQLKKHHFSILAKTEGENTFIYSQKGISNRWGNLLIHFSVVLIMIGTLFGNTRLSGILSPYFQKYPLKTLTTSIDGKYAFNEHLTIEEGKSLPIPHSKFELKLNKFELEMQKNWNMPKDFRSFVTLYENGRKVSDHLIRVNQPLTYQGVTFYQSSYGQSENINKVSLIVLSKGDKKDITQATVLIGDILPIPKTPDSIVIARFIPDFALGPNMQPFSKSNEMNNPAFLIEEYQNGNLTNKNWIFPHLKDFNKGNNAKYDIEFKEFLPSSYSVFQAVKDPGVPIIYLGFIGMILGTILSLLIDHKRVWIKISGNDSGSMLQITGNANRSLNHKVKEIDSIISDLKSPTSS